MSHSRHRSLFRAAAVAVVASGALAVPAAAFATDATVTPQESGAVHVVPKGPVKAGTEDYAPARDSATLIAAGGGLAALGAAGMGFAMLRRGRTDR
ncbi:hypothetical protein ABT160_32415 [Streptomyces sp. NPDC001941]|uniref:hypothetical protein n=1 Tax=Streptomyces sp. NPDC001941 TaxID=3154659 RepID=UPI00332EC480